MFRKLKTVLKKWIRARSHQIIPYCVQDDFNISLFGPLYFIILQEVQTANGQNRKVYRTDC